jgi:hypothetical protein
MSSTSNTAGGTLRTRTSKAPRRYRKWVFRAVVALAIVATAALTVWAVADNNRTRSHSPSAPVAPATDQAYIQFCQNNSDLCTVPHQRKP